jgi:hypothetical protein
MVVPQKQRGGTTVDNIIITNTLFASSFVGGPKVLYCHVAVSIVDLSLQSLALINSDAADEQQYVSEPNQDQNQDTSIEVSLHHLLVVERHLCEIPCSTGVQ